MAIAVETKVTSGKSTPKKGGSPENLSPAHGPDTEDDHLVTSQDDIWWCQMTDVVL
jgi:hypothetical protein